MMDDITLALLGDHDAAQRVTERGELLPCPCCAGEADIGIDSDYDGYQEWNSVFCNNCGLEINGVRTVCGVPKDEVKELIAAWNRRAQMLTPTQMALLKIGREPRKFEEGNK